MILGVLLAGGRGTRLGLGVPKALVPLGGGSLLERAMARLEEACDETVVVAPSALALPFPPSRRATDPPGAGGPLAAIVAGLASRPHDRAIVLGVDFPMIEAATLRHLLDRLEDREAVVPAPGGIPQPLAAAYGASAGARLAERLAAGERSVTVAVLALDSRILDDAALDEAGIEPVQFLNVNTPEDLERAEWLLRSRDLPDGRHP